MLPFPALVNAYCHHWQRGDDNKQKVHGAQNGHGRPGGVAEVTFDDRLLRQTSSKDQETFSSEKKKNNTQFIIEIHTKNDKHIIKIEK